LPALDASNRPFTRGLDTRADAPCGLSESLIVVFSVIDATISLMQRVARSMVGREEGKVVRHDEDPPVRASPRATSTAAAIARYVTALSSTRATN